EKCGKDPGAYGEELKKRKDVKPEEIDVYVKVHFKLHHPDGCCHCSCDHKAPPEKIGGGEGGGEKKPGPGGGGGEKKPPAPDGDGEKKPEKKCGCDSGAFQDELKKRGFGKDECEKNAKEHFKNHPDGVCHCFCGHDDKPGKKD